MSEQIPQWAIDRARELIVAEASMLISPKHREEAFARYIAAHEQPPIDPDVIAVREIAAALVVEDWLARDYLAGRSDNFGAFKDALTAYRKHKEAGK